MLKDLKIISTMTVKFNDDNPITYNVREGVIKKFMSKKDNKEKMSFVPPENIFQLNNGVYLEKCSDGAYREIDITKIGFIITKSDNKTEETVISVKEIKNIDDCENEAIQILHNFLR